MSEIKNTKIITLEQPIFNSAILKNYLLIAAGGGGKQFAVSNILLSYKLNENGTIENSPSYNLQFEKEIPLWINCFETQNIFSVCMDNLIVFYLLNVENGSFSEIYRIKSMEFYDAYLYLTCCTISKSGKYLTCGTSDGNLKVFQLQISGNIIENHKLLKDFQAHLRDINDIILIEIKNMLITCSSDGSCKVFEINTLRNLAKLTFRINQNEKKGYLFRCMYLDDRTNYLYTTQAPLTGDSYITKWNVNDGFRPVRSEKITDVSTCSIDLDCRSGTFVIGDNKGSLIYIDSHTLTKIKEMKISEISIKSVKYYYGNVFSSSADNKIRVFGNYSKGFISFFGLIKLLTYISIFYVFFLIYQEKKRMNLVQ